MACIAPRSPAVAGLNWTFIGSSIVNGSLYSTRRLRCRHEPLVEWPRLRVLEFFVRVTIVAVAAEEPASSRWRTEDRPPPKGRFGALNMEQSKREACDSRLELGLATDFVLVRPEADEKAFRH